MKLTRKLIAAVLSVCMVMALLTSASAAELEATYSPASYYDIAVTTYSRMLAFQNGGVVAAADQQSKKYGLIDATGKVVVPFQYADMWALAGGLFAVVRDSDGAVGVIKATGETVLEPSTSRSVYNISSKNGIIRIQTGGDYFSGTYEYYTPDWQPSTAEAYEGPDNGSGSSDTKPSELAQYDWYEKVGDCYRVWKYNGGGNDSVGVLNSMYEEIVPLGQYDYVGTPNADGYVSATKDGSTALYNVATKEVAKTFSDKKVSTEVYFRYLTFSSAEGKYGMMDMDETVKLDAKFDAISTDGNDCILTITGSGDWQHTYGLYTQECEQIFEDKYNEITYLADGKYKLHEGENFGMSQVSGTTATPVIPMRYKDMRVHTLQFIELFDGSKYSVVDLSNNVVVPESSEEIDAFKGNGDLGRTLNWFGYGTECHDYDGYDKSILPFLAHTDSGWTTVYADYKTGQTTDQLTGVRASNINADGWFVYQADNGLYGFAHLGKDTPDPIENTITIAASANGTVTADKATAATGDTVTITATPAQGYQCSGITVTTATGVKVEPTGSGASYTFVMPAEAVTVTGQFKLPENANLRIDNVTPDVVGFAKVKVSGMMADRVYVIRLAESDKLDKNSAILVVNNQTEYAFTCKAGQNISVLEFEKMADLQGVTGADGKVHLTPITEKSHTSARIG